MAGKVLRTLYRRPYFLPAMVDTSDSNWVLVSSNYTGSVYKMVRVCRLCGVDSAAAQAALVFDGGCANWSYSYSMEIALFSGHFGMTGYCGGHLLIQFQA